MDIKAICPDCGMEFDSPLESQNYEMLNQMGKELFVVRNLILTDAAMLDGNGHNKLMTIIFHDPRTIDKADFGQTFNAAKDYRAYQAVLKAMTKELKFPTKIDLVFDPDLGSRSNIVLDVEFQEEKYKAPKPENVTIDNLGMGATILNDGPDQFPNELFSPELR